MTWAFFVAARSVFQWKVKRLSVVLWLFFIVFELLDCIMSDIVGFCCEFQSGTMHELSQSAEWCHFRWYSRRLFISWRFVSKHAKHSVFDSRKNWNASQRSPGKIQAPIDFGRQAGDRKSRLTNWEISGYEIYTWILRANEFINQIFPRSSD